MEKCFPTGSTTIQHIFLNRPSGALTDNKTYYIQTDKHLPLRAKRALLLGLTEEMFPSSVLLPFPGSSAVSQPQLELRVPGQRVAVRTGGVQLLHVCS